MKVILDHTIVGQEQTSLSFRKDRRYAGCRLCGVLFQPRAAIETPDDRYTLALQVRVEAEIADWRKKHSRQHPDREHLSFSASNLTFTPEAANRLAPFGLVPIGDGEDPEIAVALLEAPRAPVDDVESTLKGVV